MAETDRHEPQIYQLRVALRGISPLIWGRLLVRSDGTVAELHQGLQVAFGWDDEHLNRFEFRAENTLCWRLFEFMITRHPVQLDVGLDPHEQPGLVAMPALTAENRPTKPSGTSHVENDVVLHEKLSNFLQRASGQANEHFTEDLRASGYLPGV
jgi:hypothetical protein